MYKNINDSIHLLLDNSTETNISRVIKQQNIQYLLIRFSGTNSTEITNDDLTGKITLKGDVDIDNIPFNEIQKLTDGFAGYSLNTEGTTFDFAGLLPVNARNYSGNLYMELANFNDTDTHRIRVDVITALNLGNPVTMKYIQDDITGASNKQYDIGFTPYLFLDATDGSKITNISLMGNVTKTSFVNKDYESLKILSNITHKVETSKDYIIIDISEMLVNKESLTLSVQTTGATNIKVISFGEIITSPYQKFDGVQQADEKY